MTRSKKDGSILSVCISVGWNEYSRYWELHSDTENLFVKTRATAEIDSFEGSFEYLSAPPKCLLRHKTHSVYLDMYRYLGIRDYHIMVYIFYKVYILEASGAQLKYAYFNQCMWQKWIKVSNDDDNLADDENNELEKRRKLHTTKRPSGLLFLFIKQTTLKVAFKGQARAHLTIPTNLSLCTKMEILHHLQICVQFPVIANCNG